MILVTGGSGFVGRHLVEALIGRHEAVRVLSRSASSVSTHPGMTIAIGDLSNARSLERAAEGARSVVHLAARMAAAPKERAADLHAFNVHTTAAIALAARNAGVERFIHVSSGGVYGDGITAAPHRESDVPRPGNAYERSKLAAEEALTNTLAGPAVSWTILRPAGIYGAGRPATVAFFEEVRRRAFWPHGSPHVIVHPTHVSDVVQACVGVLTAGAISDASIMNVAGERALPFHEFVAMTSRMLGVRSRQLVVPGPIGRPMARGIAVGLRAVGMDPSPAIDRVSRRWINRTLDTSLIRQRLGFTPIALEEGLRQTVELLGAVSLAQ